MKIGTSGDGVGGGRGSTIASSSRRTSRSSSSFFWDKLCKIQPYIGPIVALIIFLYGILPPTNYYELSLGVSSDGSIGNGSINKQQLRVAVFTEQGHDAIARKQEQVLEEDVYDEDDYYYGNNNLLLRYYKISTNHQILDVEQQRSFLKKNKLSCGERSVQRFDELVQKNQQHLATELWKYCSMWVSLKDDKEGKGGKNEASSTRSDSKYDAALFVDRSSPLLVEWTEIVSQAMIANAADADASSSRSSSIAVLGDPKYFPETIHSSFLYLTKSHASIAYSMLQLISHTPITALVETATSSILLQRSLYQLITTTKNDNNNDSSKWYLLEQKCHNMDPLVRVPGRPSSDNHKVFTCPTKSEFCCSVRTPSQLPLPIPQQNQQEEEEVDSEQGGVGTGSSTSGSTAIKAATTAVDPIVVLLNRHPTLPFQKITETMVRPYRSSNTNSYGEDELPYISTVRAAVYERPNSGSSGGGTTNTTVLETPNLYEVFLEKNMLPKVKCRRCLNMRRCTSHESYCQEYMKNVCDEAKELQPKFVSKRLVITPPLYRRDPSRLVPRILHQTWYETLSQDDYPNMSRLVESFKQSGWEYKFYSDADAEAFLKTHFPSEVLEAYRALIPGAFKADLFRYCALLIFGGVYADVDILLESNLDLAVEPDIGFMVPMDEPDACVWQGFIAAAPGHPFLAKAIETVVNQVRNRYTSVDIDASFCPTPNFKVLHMFDVLFTAGPCLLGASINRVLGRHGQTLLVPGDLLPEDLVHGASFVLSNNSSKIPGRTVVLKQNKWDMGCHRFSYVDRNLIVAATDLENSDDRLNQKVKKVEEKSEDEEEEKKSSDESSEEGEEEDKKKSEEEDDDKKEKKETKKSGGEHYSKAHAKSEIYGLQGLYVDLGTVDEEIRIVVDASKQQWTTKEVMDE